MCANIVRSIFVFILYMDCPSTVVSASWEDAKQLHDNLLDGYSKNIRPVQNQLDAVVVNITFYPIFIHEVDEVSGTFSFTSFINAVWKDEKIKWDSNSTGLTQFFLPFNRVWTPDLVVANPGSEIQKLGDDYTKVKYFPDGRAVWQPPVSMTTVCAIDITFYPFDDQECFVLINSWMDSPNDVKLRAPVSVVDMTNFQKNGEWDVIDTNIESIDNGEASVILIKFNLKRRPISLVVNIILPLLFLGAMNPVVFIVPVDSGERISYAITILLSFVVFMTLISDRLPETSEPQAMLSVFLLLFIAYSVIILLLAVLSLRLYFKSDDSPVPRYIRRTMVVLSCGMFSRRTSGQKDSKSVPNTEIDHLEDKNVGSQGTNKLTNGVTKEFTDWRSVGLMVDSILFVCSFIVFAVMILGFATFFSMYKSATNL